MNKFEKFLMHSLLEGGKNTKKQDKPGEARVRGQMKDTRTHYQQVIDDPSSSKEDRKEAQLYFDKTAGWVDRSARSRFPKSSRKDESTPSKMDREAAKAMGWPQRPEDEPGISQAHRRIRVRRRKKQGSGSIMSGGGVRRLRRKMKSKVYTPGTETGAIEWQLKQQLRKGLERHGKKMGYWDKGSTAPPQKAISKEDLDHYKNRPSRKKKDKE